LADWLKACGVTTVAMESTGVYWIPLFQILEDRGFEVYLVNARHVPGRRTDVSDCQCLQFLHSVGLLRAFTGLTGLAIVDAILAGERDPFALARLRHERIKASEEVIAKSLVGQGGGRSKS
jgi:transposase